MMITLNGVEQELAEGMTVIALIHQHVGSARGSAVAIDGVVVPRSQWSHRMLSAGQSVELITAVQGG
ncbi:sulfur carrier protein ThiS [Aeromicrobium sp. P5_D10]